MEWTRTAVLGALGVTLVTLLARASTSSAPGAVSADVRSVPSSSEPAVVTTHIGRLRMQQTAPVAPAKPTRDPFAFGPAVAAPRAAPRSSDVAPATIRPPVRTPAFQLIGIADESEAGRGRTAIVTDPRGVQFLSVGDVLDGFRVVAVRADGVDLAGTANEPPTTLTLK